MDKVRHILLEELVKAQSKNPSYSMRAYAAKLGISQPSISEILSGKRPLTKKMAYKILRGLDRNPDEISNLIKPANSKTLDAAFTSVDMDSYHLISDWYYYAILSLMETRGFISSGEWVAKRLEISEHQANEAIETLLRLKMVTKDPKNGKLRSSGQQLEAIYPGDTKSMALRKANRQNLELANFALDNVPLTERDFTAITLTFDPKKMEEARQMIKVFRRNFNRVMEAGHKKEVYKLCIQLYPLSKDLK